MTVERHTRNNSHAPLRNLLFYLLPDSSTSIVFRTRAIVSVVYSIAFSANPVKPYERSQEAYLLHLHDHNCIKKQPPFSFDRLFWPSLFSFSPHSSCQNPVSLNGLLNAFFLVCFKCLPSPWHLLKSSSFEPSLHLEKSRSSKTPRHYNRLTKLIL